jgi:hypothetical protein
MNYVSNASAQLVSLERFVDRPTLALDGEIVGWPYRLPRSKKGSITLEQVSKLRSIVDGNQARNCHARMMARRRESLIPPARRSPAAPVDQTLRE